MNTTIVGHRGAAGLYPENSLHGFQQALRDGVKNFELDIIMSADGHPVVNHDSTTGRTYIKNTRISRTKLIDLVKIGVPTLYQILPILEQCNHVQLEIKGHSRKNYERLCERLRHTLAACDPDKYWLTAEDRHFFVVANNILPNFRKGMVFRSGKLSPHAYTEKLADNCAAMAVLPDGVDIKAIDAIKLRGLTTSVYTINTMKEYNVYNGAVDYIISDVPTLF